MREQAARLQFLRIPARPGVFPGGGGSWPIRYLKALEV